MGLFLSKIVSLFDGFANQPVRIVMLGLDAAGKRAQFLVSQFLSFLRATCVCLWTPLFIWA